MIVPVETRRNFPQSPLQRLVPVSFYIPSVLSCLVSSVYRAVVYHRRPFQSIPFLLLKVDTSSFAAALPVPANTSLIRIPLFYQSSAHLSLVIHLCFLPDGTPPAA